MKRKYEYRINKRIISMVILVSLIVSMLPSNVIAAIEGLIPSSQAVQCTHKHDAACGYRDVVMGALCTHTDANNCAPKEVPCNSGCATIEGALPGVHIPGCTYAPASTAACAHTDGCGFITEVPGSPCTYICTEGDEITPPPVSSELPPVSSEVPPVSSEVPPASSELPPASSEVPPASSSSASSSSKVPPASSSSASSSSSSSSSETEKECSCKIVVENRKLHTDKKCDLYNKDDVKAYAKVVKLYEKLPKADSIKEYSDKLKKQLEEAKLAFDALTKDEQELFKIEYKDLIENESNLNKLSKKTRAPYLEYYQLSIEPLSMTHGGITVTVSNIIQRREDVTATPTINDFFEYDAANKQIKRKKFTSGDSFRLNELHTQSNLSHITITGNTTDTSVKLDLYITEAVVLNLGDDVTGLTIDHSGAGVIPATSIQPKAPIIFNTYAKQQIVVKNNVTLKAAPHSGAAALQLNVSESIKDVPSALGGYDVKLKVEEGKTFNVFGGSGYTATNGESAGPGAGFGGAGQFAEPLGAGAQATPFFRRMNSIDTVQIDIKQNAKMVAVGGDANAQYMQAGSGVGVGGKAGQVTAKPTIRSIEVIGDGALTLQSGYADSAGGALIGSQIGGEKHASSPNSNPTSIASTIEFNAAGQKIYLPKVIHKQVLVHIRDFENLTVSKLEFFDGETVAEYVDVPKPRLGMVVGASIEYDIRYTVKADSVQYPVSYIGNNAHYNNDSFEVTADSSLVATYALHRHVHPTDGKFESDNSTHWLGCNNVSCKTKTGLSQHTLNHANPNDCTSVYMCTHNSCDYTKASENKEHNKQAEIIKDKHKITCRNEYCRYMIEEKHTISDTISAIHKRPESLQHAKLCTECPYYVPGTEQSHFPDPEAIDSCILTVKCVDRGAGENDGGCGYTISEGKAQHNKDRLLSDSVNHWYNCNNNNGRCLVKLDVSEHIYHGDGSDCTDDYVCVVCNKIVIVGEIQHNISKDFTTTETSHYQKCTKEKCKYKTNESLHLKNDDFNCLTPLVCEDKADVSKGCGKVLTAAETEHNTPPSTAWSMSSLKHWKKCYNKSCKVLNYLAEHEAAEKREDCTVVQNCDTCHYRLLEAETEHTFSNEISFDENFHWRACTTLDCTQVTDKTAHIKNSDSMDCTQEIGCTGLNGASCDVIIREAIVGHNFEDDYTWNETQHYLKCKHLAGQCTGVTGLENHTPNTDVDTCLEVLTCDVGPGKSCGQIIKEAHTEHTFTSVVWDKDTHSLACSNEEYCTVVKDTEPHTPDKTGADCTSDINCTGIGGLVCGEILKPANAEHNMAGEYIADEENHWKTCQNEDCVVIGQYHAHSSDEWIIDRPQQDNVLGIKHKNCDICKNDFLIGTPIDAKFTITSTTSPNGYIAPTGAKKYLAGDTQTYIITPQTGAVIMSIKVDGIEVEKVSKYTFYNISKNHTIHVEYGVIQPPLEVLPTPVKPVIPDYNIKTTIKKDKKGNDKYLVEVSDTPEVDVTVDINKKPLLDVKGNATITITEEDIENAVKKAEASAKKQGMKLGNILIEFNVEHSKAIKSLNVKIAKNVQDLIEKEEIFDIKINTKEVAVGFDEIALETIRKTAKKEIIVKVASEKPEVLDKATQKAVEDRPIYDVTVTYGEKEVVDLKDGSVYLGITYKLETSENVGNIIAVSCTTTSEKENEKSEKTQEDEVAVAYINKSSYNTNLDKLIFESNELSTFAVANKANTEEIKDIKEIPAKDDIDFVLSREFMTAKDSKFSPETEITREELATVLVKVSEVDVSKYKKSSFKDVEKDNVNMQSIEWAVDNDILTTDGKKLFKPTDEVVREEIAVILVKYAEVLEKEMPKVHREVKYADEKHITKSSLESVKELQQTGIIETKNANEFLPKNSLTNIELASIIRRYLELDINRVTAEEWEINDDGSKVYYRNGRKLIGEEVIDEIECKFNATGELFVDKEKEAKRKAEEKEVEENKKKLANAREHIIKKGDSLWKISGIYDVKISGIKDLNSKEALKKLDLGEVILIPGIEK